jgi:hypothetical protein
VINKTRANPVQLMLNTWGRVSRRFVRLQRLLCAISLLCFQRCVLYEPGAVQYNILEMRQKNSRAESTAKDGAQM